MGATILRKDQTQGIAEIPPPPLPHRPRHYLLASTQNAQEAAYVEGKHVTAEPWARQRRRSRRDQWIRSVA